MAEARGHHTGMEVKTHDAAAPIGALMIGPAGGSAPLDSAWARLSTPPNHRSLADDRRANGAAIRTTGGVWSCPGSPHAAANAMRDVSPAEIEHLLSLVLREDADSIVRHVESLMSQGLALETVYLELLGPVARRLGELWAEDLCHFADVAIGVMRLQQILRRLAGSPQEETGPLDPSLRALLMPAPGELHSFGLVIVGEFFRRAGWQVQLTAPMTDRMATRCISRNWFATVAISLGSDERIAALAARIRLLRRASFNPDISVLVGGPVFVARPELARELGADTTAPDARRAVQAAHSLLRLRPARAAR